MICHFASPYYITLCFMFPLCNDQFLFAAAKACEKEVKELAAENDKLRIQVDFMVKKLRQVEDLNGGTFAFKTVTRC